MDRRVTELKDMVFAMEGILSSAFNMPMKERNEWKKKVASNINAATEVEKSAKSLKGRLARAERDVAERATLLSGASTSRAVADVDRDAAALGTARQARRGVEDMLDQAAGVLVSMGATRDQLKRTHRKLLDLATSMGISDRILKIADRRNKGDALIVYGGMAAVTLIVLMVLFWWK